MFYRSDCYIWYSQTISWKFESTCFLYFTIYFFVLNLFKWRLLSGIRCTRIRWWIISCKNIVNNFITFIYYSGLKGLFKKIKHFLHLRKYVTNDYILDKLKLFEQYEKLLLEVLKITIWFNYRRHYT